MKKSIVKFFIVYFLLIALTIFLRHTYAQNNINGRQIRFFDVATAADTTSPSTTNRGRMWYDLSTHRFRINQSGTNAFLVGGSGTVTSVSGTSPISVATGTTTPVISMTAAAAATSGYVNTSAQTFGGVKTFASPVFTGIPIAPTAAPGTNTTQLATTAFVTAAVPATITASGAVMKVGNDIQLGGDANLGSGVNFNVTLADDALASNAGIFHGSGGGFALDQSGTPGQGAASVTSGSGKVGIWFDDFNVDGNGAGAIMKDTRVTPKGIEYYADYSSTFGNESVITKRYADTKIDGTMVSTRVPYGVDANTLKTDGTGTFTYTEGASNYLKVGHMNMGVPPFYGSVTNGFVSDSPSFGMTISSGDGTVGTVTPAATNIYGGKAYNVGNNQGGDVDISSGLGNGTARNGDILIILNTSGHTPSGYLKITGLPTSSAGLPSGAIWSNAGVLTIVP